MVLERGYEAGIVKKGCQAPMWMRLVSKPVGKRPSLLHGARAKRINLVMFIVNIEARLAKVELAMEDTREGLNLIEQGMEKSLEDLREQIQDLREGVLVSQVQPMSHEKFVSFQEKVLSMLASMESRIEASTTQMESQD